MAHLSALCPNVATQALDNIAEVAKAAGSSIDNFMECTVLLADGQSPDAFEEMNKACELLLHHVKIVAHDRST